MTTPVAIPQENKATSIAAWKKAAVHYPLCPSGVRVGIRVPDLPKMIEAGDIPQHLLEVAIGVAVSGETVKPTVELITQQREFTDILVKLVVVDPPLKETDLPDVPYEDKEFLVSLATRQRDVDAEGEHIGGLSTSERFRRFRGLGEFDPTLEGA